MCKWGDTIIVEINGKSINIDRCIVPIIKALNNSGLETIASCCGHSNGPGNIALRDGREIIIARNWEEARKMESVIEFNIQGEKRK